MTYDFSDRDLSLIYDAHELGGVFGPTEAYRWWHKIADSVPLTAEHDVVDFICAFMSQYNQRIRANTF